MREFKATLALEAIRGDLTLAELATRHGMQSTMNAFETGSELRTGLGRWISYYNGQRPHSRLAGQTPDEVYGQTGATPYPGHAPDMALTRMAA